MGLLDMLGGRQGMLYLGAAMSNPQNPTQGLLAAHQFSQKQKEDEEKKRLLELQEAERRQRIEMNNRQMIQQAQQQTQQQQMQNKQGLLADSMQHAMTEYPQYSNGQQAEGPGYLSPTGQAVSDSFRYGTPQQQQMAMGLHKMQNPQTKKMSHSNVNQLLAEGFTPESVEKFMQSGMPSDLHKPDNLAFNAEYDKSQAKEIVKWGAGIRKNAVTQRQRLEMLELADRVLTEGGNSTGAGYEGFILPAKKYLEQLGIKTEGTGAAELANAIYKGQALDNRGTADGSGMPGAMSNADRVFLVQMGTNLNTTPEGRKMLLEMNRRVAKRAQEVAKMLRDFKSKNNGRLNHKASAMVDDYIHSNPLFEDIKERLNNQPQQQQQPPFSGIGNNQNPYKSVDPRALDDDEFMRQFNQRFGGM